MDEAARTLPDSIDEKARPELLPEAATDPGSFNRAWAGETLEAHEMVLRLPFNSRLDPTLGVALRGSIAGS